MTDYNLVIKLKTKIDISKILSFFEKNKYYYDPKHEITIDTFTDNDVIQTNRENISKKELIKILNEKAGHFQLWHEKNEFLVHIHGNRLSISPSMDNHIHESYIKDVIISFVKFMKENYDVVEVKEFSDMDEMKLLLD